MKPRLALALLTTIAACAPLFTRTKPIQGSRTSALVSGQVDDAAQVELNKRARESCGGRDTFEFYCREPTEDGVVVHWVCEHPSEMPACPPGTAPPPPK